MGAGSSVKVAPSATTSGRFLSTCVQRMVSELEALLEFDRRRAGRLGQLVAAPETSTKPSERRDLVGVRAPEAALTQL